MKSTTKKTQHTRWEESLAKDLEAGTFAEVKQTKKQKQNLMDAAKRSLEILPRREGFYKIRKHLELKQAEIAKVLLVSPRTVQSWEIGAREIPAHIMLIVEMLRDMPSVRKRLIHA